MKDNIKEIFIEGYISAIKDILEELSYDPEYKDAVNLLKWKFNINNLNYENIFIKHNNK